MASAVLESASKLHGMAKQPKQAAKPSGGKHKTTRINVGVPEDWHAVMRKIAAKRQQPLVYALIAIVRQEAERLEIEALPAPPWDEDAQ